MISTKNSSLPDKLPDVFAPQEQPLDHWTALIFVLIFEYLQGDNSTWKPYFDVLPATFDTPMFWSQEELKELQASSVVEKIGKAEADAMFQTKVLPVVKAKKSIFYPAGAEELSDDELLALAHRMGSTIMAYAFDLEEDEDEDDWEIDDEEVGLPKGMVPLADMLNADWPPNASIFSEGEVLVMRDSQRLW